MTAELMKRIEEIAEERSSETGPAHDYSHCKRVAATAARLCKEESADPRIAVAAALLHELFNYPKDHELSHQSGDVCAEHALEVLRGIEYPEELIEPIATCIREHAFSKGSQPTSLESRILQDSDRLDAIGAIGVARWAAVCSEMRRPFYSPVDPFCEEREADDRSFGVDHFCRKLLRIADRLHTPAARAVAAERMQFMQSFLAQLGNEIRG
ncbi:MAG: hypothetical protein ACI841_004334 [Planctomycetota bacterium]